LKGEGHVMGRADHYLIFETAGGFCGIAWNSAGITRFQLPTKSATATERILRRQMPSAKPGAPTPEVAEAVAAVRRYFEGQETDFSIFKLDLGEQDHSLSASTPRLDASDGAAQRPMAPWRRNSAPDLKPRAMSARPWRRIRWR
jgi:hypothetical protein